MSIATQLKGRHPWQARLTWICTSGWRLVASSRTHPEQHTNRLQFAIYRLEDSGRILRSCDVTPIIAVGRAVKFQPTELTTPRLCLRHGRGGARGRQCMSLVPSRDSTAFRCRNAMLDLRQFGEGKPCARGMPELCSRAAISHSFRRHRSKSEYPITLCHVTVSTLMV